MLERDTEGFTAIIPDAYAIELTLDDDICKYHHLFCGYHSDATAWCPNCSKPLLRILSLDMADPCLAIDGFTAATLPLYYCWTCNVAQSPFFYQLDTDGINILEYETGGVFDDFPYEHYPMFFPGLPVKLVKLTVEQIEVIRLINQGVTDFPANSAEEPEHQLGGIPWLWDPWWDIVQSCPICRMNMDFLAAIGNDSPDESFKFTGCSLVIMYFLMCKKCKTISVVQRY